MANARLGFRLLALLFCALPIVGVRANSQAQSGEACAGDCDGDRDTSVAELIRGVRIALDLASVDECASFDRNSDERVTVGELIEAVNAVLNGCPSSTPVRSVEVRLRPSGADSVGTYTVFNAYSETTPAADGTVAVRVAQDGPTTTLAVSASGQGLYAAITFPGDRPAVIDAQSTAEAILLINPILVPRTSAEHFRIAETVRGSASVRALAQHIDSIYRSGGDALADEQVQEEAAAAIAEVLDALAEQGAPGSVASPARAGELCSSNNGLRICPYDLAALTLYGSRTSLQVEPRAFGPLALQINVDWAVRIVELDRDRIPPVYVQNEDYVFSPDLIDPWIKPGGFDRVVIVNGAVFGGWYGVLVDPIGSLLEQVGENVARDGVEISGDGLFAVVAVSGGSNNDPSEYAAVLASEWQRDLFARAFTTNVFAFVYDAVGTLFDVFGADKLGFSKLEARRFTAALTTVTEVLQSDPDRVGINLLGDLAGGIVAEVIEIKVESIPQRTALLRLVRSAFGIVPRFFGVVTGSLSTTSRVGDLIRNVTPRESAYATLLPTSGTPTITEFALPANSHAFGIAAGPDGNLWFGGASKIGRISPRDGTITEFPLPPADIPVYNVAAGPDGNVWFANGEKVGRISPHGTLEWFEVPTANSGTYDITAGPDGNLWFTEMYASKIGRISPRDGTITEFPLLLGNKTPSAITAGPDGNLWFAQLHGGDLTGPGSIGRITPDGMITTLTQPTTSYAYAITAGPDGNVWFAAVLTNQIGRITPDGTITEFTLPTANSGTKDITTGPDGDLWFTEGYRNEIGRITPDGTITEFTLPTPNTQPNGITTGPDGSVWFAAFEKIGRVSF